MQELKNLHAVLRSKQGVLNKEVYAAMLCHAIQHGACCTGAFLRQEHQH